MVSWRRSARQPLPPPPKKHVQHVERVQLDDRGCDEILAVVAKFLDRAKRSTLTIEVDRDNGHCFAFVRIAPNGSDQ